MAASLHQRHRWHQRKGFIWDEQMHQCIKNGIDKMLETLKGNKHQNIKTTSKTSMISWDASALLWYDGWSQHIKRGCESTSLSSPSMHQVHPASVGWLTASPSRKVACLHLREDVITRHRLICNHTWPSTRRDQQYDWHDRRLQRPSWDWNPPRTNS